MAPYIIAALLPPTERGGSSLTQGSRNIFPMIFLIVCSWRAWLSAAAATNPAKSSPRRLGLPVQISLHLHQLALREDLELVGVTPELAVLAHHIQVSAIQGTGNDVLLIRVVLEYVCESVHH